MSSTKDLNIVVLGASFAGLSAVHYVLKHVLPSLSTKKGEHYHVYLVSPSSEFFFRVASPRAAVSSELMPNSKTFYPIAPGLAQYSKELVTFVLGTATAWDTEERTVTIASAEGPEQLLSYHALILATGTRTPSPLLSLHTTSEYSKSELNDVRTRLASAKSVLIAGGGPAGVETAGEIGEFLNGSPGWFSSKPAHPRATVTVVTDKEKLLPALRPALAQKAEGYLARVGVDVKYHARLETATDNDDGTTTVKLSNGEELTVDVYIPATGVTPNTEYVPKSLLTEKGFIRTNDTTLRVDAAGPRVYAVGDVGSYTRGGVMDIYDAIPVVMTNLKRDLAAFAEAGPEKADAEIKPKGGDRLYKPNLKETQLVPVGQSKGVGAIFGWKLPSLFVWLIKGRDYLSNTAPALVNGSKWKKESSWKPTDA